MILDHAKYIYRVTTENTPAAVLEAGFTFNIREYRASCSKYIIKFTADGSSAKVDIEKN